MTQQTMLEISNPFDCYVRGLGQGVAMFMLIGCITANPSFMVKIYKDGIMRVVDIMDMALYGNPQYGEPLEPETIKKWKGIKPENEIPKGNRHLRNTKKVKQYT